MSEASANLQRFDGVRYGHRCEDPIDLNDMYCRSRAEGFGAETKNRIMVGAYSLSAGYYDDYYIKAQKIRRLVSEDYNRIFANYDFIMGPVTPNTAFDLGEMQDPVAMYMSDIYTLSLNLTGRPGISVPVGFDRRNRPIGMQIIANHWGESELLNAAHAYQQDTFHIIIFLTVFCLHHYRISLNRKFAITTPATIESSTARVLINCVRNMV